MLWPAIERFLPDYPDIVVELTTDYGRTDSYNDNAPLHGCYCRTTTAAYRKAGLTELATARLTAQGQMSAIGTSVRRTLSWSCGCSGPGPVITRLALRVLVV